MIRASSLVLLLVGCSRAEGQVSWGVVTCELFCGFLVISVLARLRYDYDAPVYP